MKAKLKILFLEDVPFDFELIKHQIKKSGIEFVDMLVETREDYKDALQSFKPDIILSDYSLPQFDGMQALEIRQKEAPHVPFILITGALNEETAVKVMKAGSDDYVLKQSLTRLGSAIESAIAKWEAIEAKKQAEEALKENEQKFRELANLLPQVVYEIDIRGNLTYLNDLGYELFGFPKKDLKKGISVTHSIAAEDRVRAKKSIQSILSTGEASSNPEYTALKKDGSRFPIVIYSSVIFKENAPIGLRGVIVDITEQKQKEERIRKLSQAVEQSPVSIVITNLKGDIEYTNPKFTQVTGYLPEEAVGKNPRILKSKESGSHEYKELWETITSGNEWRGEFHNQKKNGELYWEFATISSIKNKEGKITHFVAVKEDITERKHAEEQLRESEKKYRKLIETTSEGFWLLDDENNTVDVNQSLCNLLGYFRDEIIGKTPFSFVDEVNHQIFKKQIIESKTAKNRNYEIILITKGGDSLSAIFNATTLFDDTGERVGSFAFITDISERKKAEELLKSSEERLKILFESAPDAYYLTDLKGTIIDGNKAAEELLGYKREELIGKNFIDLNLLSAIEVSKASANIHRSALGLGSGPEEYTLNHKGGRHISAEIRTYPVQIEKRTVVLGIAHDMTERKKAEKLLRKSEQKHRNLIETTSEGFWLFNKENKTIDVNQSLCDMLGYPKNKIIGKSPFSFIENTNHEIVKKQIVESKTIRHRNYEVLMMKKNGDTFPSIFNSTTLLDDAGKYVGFFAFITDITVLRLKEESIKKSERQLRELTIYMDAKFEEERKRIGKEIHDGIGQILTGLIMDLQWVEKKWPIESVLAGKKFQSMRSTIAVGVKEIQNLSIQLRPEMLDNLGLIETIRAEAEKFDERSGISCEVKFIPDYFEVEFERTSTIYRILMELLTNVYRYADASIITIKLEMTKDNYLFIFSDNGIGITQDQINDQSSFGLLTIIERVNKWKGSVKISGEHKKGTTVKVIIPY